MLQITSGQKALLDRINALQAQIQSLSGDPQAISALTTTLTNLQSQVNGISVPDISGLATKTALTNVENKIPIVPAIPDISGLASKTALSTVEGKIPAGSTVAPPNTDLVQQVGTSTKFAREDHTHKARIKRAMVTIGADGTAKWDFAEPFTMIPIVTHMVQETSGQNRVNVIITSISTTSVTVYADRMRNLPVMQQLNSGLIGTVSAVVSGVNGLITSLSGYNLLGGPGSANGVKVHLYAAEPIA